MRVLAVSMFALSVAAALPAWAADLQAESKIVAATVYADRATVTRQTVVDLPEGASVVVLKGLPASLMTDALRAEGKAAADVVLGAIETKLQTSAELAAPRERELEAKITTLEDQKALVQADLSGIEQKQKFLESLSAQASLRARENIAAIDLKPEQWSAAATTLADQTSSLLKAQAAKNIEMRELDKQIAALNEELQQLQTGQTNSIQVRVPLDAKAPTRLTLKVSYQVPSASWRPVYDVRLDTEKRDLKLTQYGEVIQQTGEDWQDVALVLSTAQPAQQVALPELSPLWVSFYQNYADKARFKSLAMDSAMNAEAGAAPQMAMMAAPAAPEPERAATFVAANLNASGYAAEYSIVGPSSVLSDGSARKVMIGDRAAKVALSDVVMPQYDDKAYLVASTQIEGEAPLLPGTANLFRDGTFIGSVPLGLVRTGGKIDLSFGQDDQVEISRKLAKDETGESGVLVGKSKTITRELMLSVANLHKQPIDVVVKYRLPVPQDEQIKLTLNDKFTSPQYAMDVDDVKGLMVWKMPIAAKEKKPLQIGWTLSWPTDTNINFNSPY